jgi:hypothetical protein
MDSIFFRRLQALADRHGRLEEQQLVGRWAAEIDSLLAPATRGLLANEVALEFGIEDSLCLKINLLSRGLPAASALLAFANLSPALAPWAEYILRRQLRYHCGIKITPTAISREIYVYPKNHDDFSATLGGNAFADSVKALKPLCVGIDDQRGPCMYLLTPVDEPWIDALRKELGLKDWHGANLLPWRQLRFDGQEHMRGKTGIQFKPLPAQVLARAISHYPFPWFRYLIPLSTLPNGNLGRDPVSGRYAFYATVS